MFGSTVTNAAKKSADTLLQNSQLMGVVGSGIKIY